MLRRFLYIYFVSSRSSNSVFAILLLTQPKMHAEYSEAVDHSPYQDDGLSNEIPLRVYREQHLEIQGSMRAQND